MTTTTRNEAAEQLLGALRIYEGEDRVYDRMCFDLKEALAAERLAGYADAAGAKNLQKLIADERRATVERIRARLSSGSYFVSGFYSVETVNAILDDEAAR